MASKPTDASMPFLNLGRDQTEAMLSMQKEFLDAYDQSSRAWLARVKSEGDLWSELAKKLSETRSAPEALAAYQQCVAQRMQMAAEDGRLGRKARRDEPDREARCNMWQTNRIGQG